MRGKVTGQMAGHFFCAGRMAFPPVSENFPRTAPAIRGILPARSSMSRICSTRNCWPVIRESGRSWKSASCAAKGQRCESADKEDRPCFGTVWRGRMTFRRGHQPEGGPCPVRGGGAADRTVRRSVGVRLRHGTAHGGHGAPVQKPCSHRLLRKDAEAGGKEVRRARTSSGSSPWILTDSFLQMPAIRMGTTSCAQAGSPVPWRCSEGETPGWDT